MSVTYSCPLCTACDAAEFEAAHGRQYLRCANCALIFMAHTFHLSPADERTRYALHRNSPADPAYRKHLAKAVNPLVTVLVAGSSGLDFGCGPGPTASVMLGEAGFKARNYDPYFTPDEDALRCEYDFIICTETAEHFINPAREFGLLHALLRPGGWLSLMTQLYEPGQSLASWWYTKDPTHVSLYSRASLQWIADNWGWRVVSSSDSVHLFTKSA